MKKETSVRLLLSLLTAFIMVAGAIGAAIPTFSSNWSREESAAPTLDNEAVSVLDMVDSEIGEAPISAKDTTKTSFSDMTGDEVSGVPVLLDTQEDPTTEGGVGEPKDEEHAVEFTEVHGTRNPDTVDAGGPYGSGIPFDPYYEGDPITFDAQIEPEGEHDNYKFRWDVDSDGIFEGPGDASTDYFGEDGESSFTKTFYDDNVGRALVQAWDGSFTWESTSGKVANGASLYTYWTWSGYYYVTYGWDFEVTKDCQIDQLGAYLTSYPYAYYNIRIWDDTSTVVAQVTYPSMSYNAWTFHSITPVDIEAGRTYTISGYIYTYYGYMPASEDLPDTPDGIVIVGDGKYAAGNAYPGGVLGSGYKPMVDFHYTCTYSIPNVIEDTAEIVVWNREPTVFDATVTPTSTSEGEAGSEFSAWMVDLGLDDEWEFQWDWGDGTMSPWMRVPTWSGGIRVLWLHSYTGAIDPIMNGFAAQLGPNLIYQEQYDCGQAGNYNSPGLDYMKQFDVVIVGSNYIPAAQVGDDLADYAEQGGGVVELVAMMHPTFGIAGRWRSEGYSVFPQSATVASGTSITVYDPTHPIIDGIAGTVSNYGCSLMIGLTSITPGAVLLADYNTAYKAAAYRVENERHPGSGRVVGLNIFAQEGYHSGDVYKVIANAAFWASQNEPAQKLYQPYQLPIVSHIYKDDHPEHVTPSDQVQPRVRVRDDDHCHDAILGQPVIVTENFNGPWGPYGDNPPPGWTILDVAIKNWDYNDWHRYSYSTLGGYVARVYMTPDEDQDEELISPEIDVSSYSTVTVHWDHYRYDYYSEASMDIDIRLDGGSWITMESWTGGYGFVYDSFDVTTGGASILEYRFHMTDWGANSKYWYVGNTEVTAGGSTLFSEDWEGSWGPYGDNPPSGWTIIDNGVASSTFYTDDWHKYTFSSSYGGDNTPAARMYYYPYGPANDWLISPVMDLTIPGLNSARMQFRHWYYQYNYYVSYGYVKYSLDGGAWQILETFGNGPGTYTDIRELEVYNLDFALGHTLQIAFQRYGEGDYVYYYWYVDNFVFEAIPELKHIYGMTPWLDGPPINVVNAFPTTTVPDDIASVVPEDRPITFEGIEITDPALWEDTEEFWYRWNFDDGEITPWIYKGTMTKMDALLIHSLNPGGHSGDGFQQIVNAINSNPFVTRLDYYNPFDTMDTPELDELEEYGVIILATNYANTLGWWATAMEKLGNNLADYLDHNSGGFVSLMFTLDLSMYYGDLFGLPGTSRYVADDYGAFEPEVYPFTPGSGLGAIYDPNHPVMQGVDDLNCLYVQSGDYSTTIGGGGMAAGRNGVLLADWSTGNSAIGVKELSNGARSVNIGAFANAAGDYNRLVSNAITWSVGGNIVDQFIYPETHTFGDNGVYYVDLQIVDDDMNWIWPSGDAQPTYVGPAGEEDQWISHNVMPVEVQNQDPVIAPRVRAYAELDLSLRMSGTKTHEATMTLYENGVSIGFTEVTRVPGSPNVGVISNVDLEMTKGFDYEVVIDVDPNGDGGSNPTWLFDMIFPDGKYKEFKFTFNDEHGWTQTITSSELKRALLGHDIIFEASADDVGSDDLAFIWNFGDSTPFGVHLYSNKAQSTTVEGYSDEATVMFNQLPDRDPAFEKDINTVRSPQSNPMHADDMISHVFDENQPYYYYVHLTVLDDDVDDDYPSTQLHPNSGSDTCYIELDFR